MLAVVDLYKNYEGQPLLKGVSFEAAAGETVCLLGRSGSGKSTILRIIAGIETAEQGKILWQGRDLTDVPVHQRAFGFMFQDYALFPHRNVFENVAFGLRMQNLSKAEIVRRTSAVLEKVNMTSFAKRSVTELSGGEQQRVALARALAPEPRLLMLDEPLGALDRSLREQLMQELRDVLHASGIPAIYVTHDQEEAFTLGDRLILLHDGQIEQSGTPQEIYATPRNPWVARFLGLNNLVPGKVSALNPLSVKSALGDLQVKTPPGAALAIGQPVTLLVRPDAAQLNGESGNTVRVEVRDVVFLGQQYRVRAVCGGVELDLMLEDVVQVGEVLVLHLGVDGLDCFEEGQ
ncbi:MAG: iron ABC transporter ATP-binding protein [Chloroflexi bacterium HGW-Chloroflexi-10]|nr:MAG: iron ABC transporter ATP-binding protein [Chloroflexi bacterium HGW-Chloroflexi-10]